MIEVPTASISIVLLTDGHNLNTYRRLQSQGPTALKGKLKRQRLTALTAAALAPFSTSRTDTNRSATPTDTSDRGESEENVVDLELLDGPTLAGGCRENDHSEIPPLCPGTADGQSSPGEILVESGGSPPRALSTVSLIEDLLNDQRKNDQQQSNDHNKKNGPKRDNDQDDDPNDQQSSRNGGDAPVRPERRDTLTIAVGMEEGGVDVVAAKKPRLLPRKSAADTVSGVRGFHHDAEVGMAARSVQDYDKKSPSFLSSDGRIDDDNESDLNMALEHIWRASLSDGKRYRGAKASQKEDLLLDAYTAATATKNSTEDRAAADRKFLATPFRGEVAPPSPSAVVDIATPPLADVVGGLESEGDVGSEEEKLTSRLVAEPTRQDKLPAEVLASMLLLADHEFAVVVPAGDNNVSSGGAFERGRRQRGRDAGLAASRPPHPFPNLPYGFTDLGRRVNVENAGGGENVVRVVGAGAAAEGGRGDSDASRETAALCDARSSSGSARTTASPAGCS